MSEKFSKILAICMVLTILFVGFSVVHFDKVKADDTEQLTVTSDRASVIIVPTTTETVNLTYTNNGTKNVTVTFSISNVPIGWSVVPNVSSAFIPANSSYTVMFTITCPADASYGSIANILISGTDSRGISADQTITVTVGEVIKTVMAVWDSVTASYSGELTTNPKTTIAGGTCEIEFRIRNLGNSLVSSTTVSVSGVPSIPAGWIVRLEKERRTTELTQYSDSSTTLSLTDGIQAGATTSVWAYVRPPTDASIGDIANFVFSGTFIVGSLEYDLINEFDESSTQILWNVEISNIPDITLTYNSDFSSTIGNAVEGSNWATEPDVQVYDVGDGALFYFTVKNNVKEEVEVALYVNKFTGDLADYISLNLKDVNQNTLRNGHKETLAPAGSLGDSYSFYVELTVVNTLPVGTYTDNTGKVEVITTNVLGVREEIGFGSGATKTEEVLPEVSGWSDLYTYAILGIIIAIVIALIVYAVFREEKYIT